MSAPSQSELQAETEVRLRFEMLLADICAQFVNVAASEVDSKIANAQRVICESLRIDHSSVWQVSEENPDLLVMTHVYRDPNIKPLPIHPIAKEYFPWSSSKILNKEIVCVPNTATLPPEAATDKESWEEYGIHSSLVIPLSVGGGSVIGVLAFDSLEEHDWLEPLQRRLQILAHVFAQALERKRAEQKREMAEERLREYEKAVEGLEEMVAVVDREYRYLIANRRFLNLRQMTKGQVEGRGANEVLNKGVFEAVIKEKLDECFRGNVVRFEMKYTYPELGERDVSVSYFPIAGKTGVDRVACIVQDITERKRAEEGLRELNHTLEGQTALLQSREELLKIFVKNVPAGVAMLDRDMRYLQVSDRWCVDYSVDSSQILGRSHYELFPDIPQRWKAVHRSALEGETLRAEEERWDREGGTTTWVRWEVRPWKTPNGIIGGILIFAEDITRRKQAEEALLSMSRKLIEAQEQERTRIGRELHDDINQRLAMLALELEQLQANPSEVQTRLQELRKQTTELSNDVQALSHELHSSKLDYLGVVSGIKSWCKEFGERQKMEIDFKTDVSSVLPLNVGICLFRVLQESLHNAAKHSGVKRIEVQLSEHLNEVHLLIGDSGRGFDVEAAIQGQGLGLTSMQERVRLLNGSVEIQSKPMGGTTIHVRVPLEAEHGSQRAAG